MVLHTSDNCVVSPNVDQTGFSEAQDCYVWANNNYGCRTESARDLSYGAEFNANGGGTYVLEWTSDHIKIWFFARGDLIPPSLNTDAPDPDEFGTPSANFQGACDIDEKFKDMQIIFDTTFCGDWAGSAYGASSCPMSPGEDPVGSCKRFVSENPEAFEDAYWLINYLRVYQRERGFDWSLEAIGDRVKQFFNDTFGSDDDDAGVVPVDKNRDET